MRPPQLPLALALPDHATFETFEPGENVLVLKALERFLDARGERLWLWGSPGAGKSHLLQAACQRVRGSQWLPGALVKETPEAVLAAKVKRVDGVVPPSTEPRAGATARIVG